MNKKGFVFIEMIVTTVVLIIALLVLYSTYANAIQAEKKRLYYDDIAYVYKAENIHDVVVSKLDLPTFYTKVSNNSQGFVYLFGYDSSGIWTTGERDTDVQTMATIYNFMNLVYIKIKDIPQIKKCLNGRFPYDSKITDPSDPNYENSVKCEKTKTFIHSYSREYMEEYLRTIDVPTSGANVYENHDAILVTIFVEKKNGESGSITNDYEQCIQKFVSKKENGFVTQDCDLVADKAACKKEAYKKYTANENISYDMGCQNAYHVAWVYF